MVLFGRGIPELVEEAGLEVSFTLYNMTAKATTNKTRETIKRKMANPSI